MTDATPRVDEQLITDLKDLSHWLKVTGESEWAERVADAASMLESLAESAERVRELSEKLEIMTEIARVNGEDMDEARAERHTAERKLAEAQNLARQVKEIAGSELRAVMAMWPCSVGTIEVMYFEMLKKMNTAIDAALSGAAPEEKKQ